MMCAQHWFMLPQSIRDEVWKTYRPGQEIDKRPSAAYMAALAKARAYIEELETAQIVSGKIPAISLWRPWDAAIINGPKRIENRAWPWNPRLGDRVVLHVAKRYDDEGEAFIRSVWPMLPPSDELRARPSGLRATARVVDCVKVAQTNLVLQRGFGDQEQWVFGPYAIRLDDIEEFPFVIPYRGQPAQPFFVDAAWLREQLKSPSSDDVYA